MGGWCYMLRCSDDSYYVGSTSYEEIAVRVGEHNESRYGGYTAKRRPVTLVWSEWCNDLQDAHVLERRIKGWRREKKEALIRHDWAALPSLASRPSARRPSRLAALVPQGDALLIDGKHRQPEARTASKDAAQLTDGKHRHREVRAQRASKDDGEDAHE